MAPRKPARSTKAPSATHRPKTGNKAPGPQGGELRIIGGEWRSRVLRFPDAGGIRPTPSRIRETLFNWLNYHLAGSRCLDLFAGSGALGLESLSRGASVAVLVDHTPALARALTNNLSLLGSTKGEVRCQPVEQLLAQSPEQPFNILFMDPPFRQGWLERLIPLIETNHWVMPGSWIYMEYESERSEPVVPKSWHLHRSKMAGQVTYALYRVQVLNGE